MHMGLKKGGITIIQNNKEWIDTYSYIHRMEDEHWHYKAVSSN